MGMPPEIIDFTTALDLIQQHVGCMLRERDEVVKPMSEIPATSPPRSSAVAVIRTSLVVVDMSLSSAAWRELSCRVSRLSNRPCGERGRQLGETAARGG